MLVALYELLGSLVESQDIQGLRLAMDMARRVTSELETRMTKKEFEGSKETLENVIQGLQLLHAYGISLITAEQEQNERRQRDSERVSEASKVLKELMKRDRIWLPKSLGTAVNRPASRGRLLAAVGVMKEAMVRKCAQVAKWIPGGGQVISLLQRDRIMAALASAHLTLLPPSGSGFGSRFMSLG